MEWLLAHAEDELPATTSSEVASEQKQDTGDKNDESLNEKKDEEAASGSSGETAKSIKCEDCLRLFRNQVEVEFHAAKSGHLNFSESTEEKKALTEEEKKQQLALLEEKMRLKRADREEREKQEALEKERLRIKSGKDMTEVKRKMEEEEMKKIVEQRKREKEEERKAKQRVRELIEADKAARKAKSNPSASPATPSPSAPTQTVQQPTTPVAQKDYKESRIQLRLPDGSSFIETFDKNEQLAAVRLFLQLKLGDPSADAFSMMTTFPRKVFSAEDYELTLEKLQLVPSATIMVTKNARPGM